MTPTPKEFLDVGKQISLKGPGTFHITGTVGKGGKACGLISCLVPKGTTIQVQMTADPKVAVGTISLALNNFHTYNEVERVLDQQHAAVAFPWTAPVTSCPLLLVKPATRETYKYDLTVTIPGQPLPKDTIIQAHYRDMKGPDGVLGRPCDWTSGNVFDSNFETSDHMAEVFQNGAIFVNGGKAYEVHGAIWAKYKELGKAAIAILGLPISDEKDFTDKGNGRGNVSSNWRRSDFQGGFMVYRPGKQDKKDVLVFNTRYDRPSGQVFANEVWNARRLLNWYQQNGTKDSDGKPCLPNLIDYEVKPPESQQEGNWVSYNCVAWVIGNYNKQYLPEWPKRYAWEKELRATQMFATEEDWDHYFANNPDGDKNGYEPLGSLDFSLQPGMQKIVLYTKKGEFPHVAKQSPDGTWTNKTGPLPVVRMLSPYDFAGNLLGKPHKVYYRKRP